MTLFEYVAAFMAILIALAVARSLDGLRCAFGSTGRYWVHATWVVVKLANPLNYWWSFWAARGAVEWTMGMFLLAAAWPALFYLQMTGLVTTRPEEVDDWRTHFYGQRVGFFVLNLLLITFLRGLVAASRASGVVSVPDASWSVREISLAASSVAALVLSVVGISTDNPRIHAVIAVVAATNMVSYLLLRGFYTVLAAE